MKYLFCVLALFSILYLSSCGDDNTTNNGNGIGGETVIFSMDSLVLNIPIMGFSNDTNVELNNFNNARITFDCSTNADSINAFASFRLYALDDSIASSNVILDSTVNQVSLLNNSYFVNLNTTTNFAILNIHVQCIRNDSNSYFIKLKNIKVTKTR